MSNEDTPNTGIPFQREITVTSHPEGLFINMRASHPAEEDQQIDIAFVNVETLIKAMRAEKKAWEDADE